MSNWTQKTVTLPAFERGMHLITDQVVDAIPELTSIGTGMLHIFILHTSASITINENASPAVRVDMKRFFNNLVPDSMSDYMHSEEGPDDMPAHIKAALLGNSLHIPVSEGALVLGTWQGIFLCEHRNRGGRRKIVLTLNGEPVD